MVYELRVYDIVPGRMPAINNRFANITLDIFQKHGIKVIGFWEDLIGTSNRLTYLIQWESLAHREKAWNAFVSDPDWLAARAKTEADGPIVAKVTNTIMRPTSYSPLQ